MKKTLATLSLLLVVSAAFAQNSFSLSISPTATTVNNVNAVLNGTVDGSSFTGFIPLIDTAPVGTTSTFDFNTNVDPSGFRYGLFGTYGETGVTLGVNSVVAPILLGQSWSSIITNPLFTEEAVRSALDSSNFATQLLFAQYLSDLSFAVNGQSTSILANLRSDVTLLNFSNASGNGSATIESVPEPMTMTLLAAGLAGLARRRRRA